MMMRALAVALCCAVLTSCARAPLPFDEAIESADLRSIAVVPSADPPQSRIDTPAPKSHAGAALGAGGGVLGGAALGYASAGILCTIGGPLCMLIVVPAAIAGGAIGGAAGNVMDHAGSDPGESAAKLTEALAQLRASEALAGKTYERARQRRGSEARLVAQADYPALASQGVTAALEVALVEFEVLHRREDMALVLKARSRLYRTSDGRLLEEKTSETRTGYRSYEDWAANDARPLREAIDRAYARLSDEIISEQLRPRPRAGSAAPQGG
jgi:hypothetical protein